jgi:lambda family phage tail tape measure protein
MAAIENFVLKIKVEGQKAVDDLSKSVTSLGTTIGGFGGYAGKMTSAISGIVGGMAGMATIAGTAATAFVGLGLKAIALADELSDISDATGITAGALNNFRNSLLDAGGKTEDFSTLAAKLNQNLGEAATGNETAQKAFQKLGVFVRDAGGNVRNTGDVLRDAVAKLAAIEDPAKRAALAVDIFGKSAAKLDFTKLNAGNDFAKDAQIAQLAKYQTAIDSIAKSVNDSLITSFGKLAISIGQAEARAKKAEDDANARGETYGGKVPIATYLGIKPLIDPNLRKMTDEEKAALDLNKKLTEAYKDQRRELDLLGKKNQQLTLGDFGADSEAKLKAAAESEKRIKQSAIETERFNALKTQNTKTADALRGANERIAIDAKAADDIKNIQINLAQDIKKAAEDVRANDKISAGQQNAEIAAKAKELQSKSAIEIQKIKEKAVTDAADYTLKTNAKVFSEEESQRQKTQEELAAEQERLNKLFETGRKITEQAAEQNKELSARAQLALASVTMTDRERANAEELFKIEQDRLALLKQIADTYGDNEFEKRTAEEKKINDLLNQRRDDALVAQNEQQLQREDFTSGWEKSYRQYVENSTNAAQQGQQAFETLSRGFEDAFTKMFRSGEASFKNLKKGFKDLANSMIADFIRIQAQSAFKSLFGSIFGGIGGGGEMAGAAVLGLPGYAAGGSIPAGQLSVVGERGPELFLPKQAGTIIPNGAMGGSTVNNTAVTYNIQAVDASSFRSMLARDPEFIHNVAEQGRRQLPIRSRR